MSQQVQVERHRAVGYVRVSQVGGREGDSFLSPELQREKINAWATYRGFTIVRWYVDLDVSGREGVARPEFERMMHDAAAGDFDAVAVYRLTRFARSVSQAASRYAELRRHDVALVSVTEDIDTTTASGSFMQNMLFALAEFESQRIGEEWRNVHANRRRRGIAHVTRPMYGFTIKGAEIVGVEPREAEAVLRAFELRADATPYPAISVTLSSEGYVSKRGYPRIAPATLSAMLRNPLYAGLVRTSEGDLIEGKHDGIVPRDLWDAVQAIPLKEPWVARHGVALLSGLAVCAGCGYRMTCNTQRHGRVYRCASRNRSRPCPRQSSIKIDALDAYVEAAFLARFDESRMPNSGRVKGDRRQAKARKELDTLRGRIAEMNVALDGLADERYVKGSIPADEYDRQAHRYLSEREKAAEAATALELDIATLRPLDMPALSLWPSLDLEAKRRALRILIASVVVGPARRRGRIQPNAAEQRCEIVWRA